MPPVRGFSCNGNLGRFRPQLDKLMDWIREHPEDMRFWTQTLDKLKLCPMCRISIISYYDEFTSHQSMPNGRRMNHTFHDSRYDSVNDIPDLITQQTGAKRPAPITEASMEKPKE